MHGMLSAAVVLAAFAVIALAGAASVAWLYRAAAATAPRPQAARPGFAEPAGNAGAAARAAADLTAVRHASGPGQPSSPAQHGTAPGDEEEFGVVWEAPGGMTADHRGSRGGPDQVYDPADWPDPDAAAHGPDDRGPHGPRPWPDLARSLYSRGWPAMDSTPPAASAWPRPGSDQHPDLDRLAVDRPAPNRLALDSIEPVPPDPISPGLASAEQSRDADNGAPSGRHEGAQVYVLGEPRRTGL